MLDQLFPLLLLLGLGALSWRLLRPSPEETEEGDAPLVGKLVEVQTSSRVLPELNGRTACVLRYDPKSDRYLVRMRWKMSDRFDDLKARLQGTAPVERYNLPPTILRVLDDQALNNHEKYELETNSYERGRMKL